MAPVAVAQPLVKRSWSLVGSRVDDRESIGIRDCMRLENVMTSVSLVDNRSLECHFPQIFRFPDPCRLTHLYGESWVLMILGGKWCGWIINEKLLGPHHR